MKQHLHLLLCAFIISLCTTPLRAQTITTFAGNGIEGYTGDGSAATAAEIDRTFAVAVNKKGDVFIADAINYCVRKVDPAGIITTFAGNGTGGYSGDGGLATAATFAGPVSVTVDDTGSVYIADYGNNVIRKVDTFGIITTIAGNGVVGPPWVDQPAISAYLDHPSAVATDHFGNLYLIDADYVFKINASGIISVFAGTGSMGYSGDGGAATAAEIYPYGIACDTTGNVYIADGTNNRVRKVDTFGIITTIAGTGVTGGSGDGGAATAAELNSPLGVSADRYGNVYVSDAYNYRVRKINAAGIITTIAGNGTNGFSGDGGPATTAEMYYPWGITTDASGNVYINTPNDYRVRKVSNHVPTYTGGTIQTLTLCAGATVSLDTILAAVDSEVGQRETWTVITAPYSGTAVAAYSLTSTGGLLTPAGLYYIPATGFSGNDSFTVLVCDGISSDTVMIHTVVNPLPNAGTISGPVFVCMGATDTLTDTASGGMWSSSNASATNTAGAVTGITAGTDTLTYIVTNGCGTDTQTYSIAINSVPNAGIISGPATVCVNTTITLTDTASGGMWSSSNASATNTAGAITGIAAGTDTLIYIVTNGCGADTQTHTITINPLPHAGAITGTDSICPGDTVTLAATAGSGAWSSSNSIVSSVSVTGLVAGLSPGTDTIRYMVTNTCGTDTAIFPLTVRSLVACTEAIAALHTAVNTIHVYPNPNDGVFTVNVSSQKDEAVTITITNATGEKVCTLAGSTNKPLSIQLHVSSGIYLLSATTQQAAYWMKVAVQQ